MSSVTKNKNEKVYYCEYIEKNGMCKETKEENFQRGRYNICLECRKKQSKDYRETFKEEKYKKLDPDKDLKKFTKVLINENFSKINKDVNKLNEKIINAIDLENRRSHYLQQCIEKAFCQIEDLRSENEILKKEIKKLYRKFNIECNSDKSKILPDLSEL